MAHRRKAKKYNDLKKDLEEVGRRIHLIPFKVSFQSQITKRNKDSLRNVFNRNQIKVKKKQLFQDLSKIFLCAHMQYFKPIVYQWIPPSLNTTPTPMFQLHCHPMAPPFRDMFCAMAGSLAAVYFIELHVLHL